MARQVRIQYPGAVYHVLARGDRREKIFMDDEDRALFLETLGQACMRTGWQIHAWVLMGNHYHMATETPEPNLVEGMSWLQTTYTRRFNARHRLWGHLFGGRYKAIAVEGEGKGELEYFGALLDYIHLNPVRAGLIGPECDSLLKYRWSSLPQAYAQTARQRPAWMTVGRGLEAFGLKDRASNRRKFIGRLEKMVQREDPAKCGLSELAGQSLQSTLRRGWYWGSQSFRERLLDKLRLPGSRGYRTTAANREHATCAAEEWIKRGCKWFGVKKEDLLASKGQGPKAAIAWAIHHTTSVPQKWIATELNLKSAANVSQQIRRWNQDEQRGKEEKKWRSFVKN